MAVALCGLSSALQRGPPAHCSPWSHMRWVLGGMPSLGATWLPVGVSLGSWGLHQGLAVMHQPWIILDNTFYSKT